jgi:AraC family transcriptional regulator
MRTLDSPRLKSPHGIRISTGLAREWNGITVQVLELRCDPGRVWQDLSSPLTSLSVIQEQDGGRVEARTKITQPCASRWFGAQHLDFLPAGMPVWGYSDGIRGLGGTRLFFDVPRLGSLLGEDLDSRRLDQPRLRFHDDRLQKLGALLGAECAAPGDRSGLYGDSLTVAIVVDLLRLTKRSPESGTSPRLAAWQFRRATEFMTAHLSTSVRLSDLAEITGLSQSYFGRAFKASTGVTPHRWLLNARIARAQELLLEAELPLVQIALETGFSEQSHFTRVFRSVVGTSPAAWQRHRRT